MSNTNSVVTNAIASLNEAAKNRAENKASCLINQISGLNMALRDNNKVIATLQSELKAIEGEVINFESVVGQTPGSTVNTDSIVGVIEKMNKNRQAEIASRANQKAHAIQSLQDDNTRLNKDIASLRKALSEITVESVDETAVLG